MRWASRFSDSRRQAQVGQDGTGSASGGRGYSPVFTGDEWEPDACLRRGQAYPLEEAWSPRTVARHCFVVVAFVGATLLAVGTAAPSIASRLVRAAQDALLTQDTVTRHRKAAMVPLVPLMPQESFNTTTFTTTTAPPVLQRCAGQALNVPGIGRVKMVGAGTNKPGFAAGNVTVQPPFLMPSMTGRAYFGSTCEDGHHYDHRQYLATQLLGRTLRYSVDLTGAGCGCNAALYLTPMQQNVLPSECKDYYCDANSVCGVSCAEIDIQEANQVAWYSTLHSSGDGAGSGAGYGANRRNWAAGDYGRGGRCVDTGAVFEVAASFPLGPGGVLTAMTVSLSQPGRPCNLELSVGAGYVGLQELTQVLREGVTIVVSYWGVGEDMSWMDGRGADGTGPCPVELPEQCGKSVRFWNFRVT